MTTINASIIAKASGVTGESPLSTDLEVAEIAINTADGKIFTKHTNNVVKELGGVPDGFGLGDLDDVDLSTPPLNTQVIAYNSSTSTWQPVDQSTGGGGGGSGYLIESQTAALGVATFSGIGFSGLLRSVSTDLAAWIVLYESAAARTSDATRAFTADPSPGSGVLFEAYLPAGGSVTVSPAAGYFNGDSPPAEAIYAAVRDQSKTAVNAAVVIEAYATVTS